MCPKIDMLERVRKKLEFGGDLAPLAKEKKLGFFPDRISLGLIAGGQAWGATQAGKRQTQPWGGTGTGSSTEVVLIFPKM
jgi:hypothetical protein